MFLNQKKCNAVHLRCKGIFDNLFLHVTYYNVSTSECTEMIATFMNSLIIQSFVKFGICFSILYHICDYRHLN